MNTNLTLWRSLWHCSRNNEFLIQDKSLCKTFLNNMWRQKKILQELRFDITNYLQLVQTFFFSTVVLDCQLYERKWKSQSVRIKTYYKLNDNHHEWFSNFIQFMLGYVWNSGTLLYYCIHDLWTFHEPWHSAYYNIPYMSIIWNKGNGMMIMRESLFLLLSYQSLRFNNVPSTVFENLLCRP